MNKSIIIGNLVRDPEARMAGDAPVCTFTVAVSRRVKEGSEPIADYIPVVAWRKLAENCEKYLAKGRKVAVIGSIQTRKYQGQNGDTKYVTEIVADEVEFLSAKPKEEPKDEYGGFEPLDEDDLPF